jgi:hypothetical protein
VYFLPEVVVVDPAFVHAAPALTAAFAGTGLNEMGIRIARIPDAIFLNISFSQ